MRISVVPEELRSLGSRVHAVGADVVATRGVLMGAVDGAGDATGVPEAAAAFDDMCSAWTCTSCCWSPPGSRPSTWTARCSA